MKSSTLLLSHFGIEFGKNLFFEIFNFELSSSNLVRIGKETCNSWQIIIFFLFLGITIIIIIITNRYLCVICRCKFYFKKSFENFYFAEICIRVWSLILLKLLLEKNWNFRRIWIFPFCNKIFWYYRDEKFLKADVSTKLSL